MNSISELAKSDVFFVGSMHVTFQKVMSIFYVEWRMHFSFQREIPFNAFIDIGITKGAKTDGS